MARVNREVDRVQSSEGRLERWKSRGIGERKGTSNAQRMSLSWTFRSLVTQSQGMNVSTVSDLIRELTALLT